MKDFPLIRSARSAVLSAVLVAGPLLILSINRLLGAYAALAVLFLLPVACCLAGAVGGALPMTLDAAAGLLAMARAFGSRGAALAAVYLLPVLAAFLCVIRFRVPFWKGCAVLIGTHIVALSAAYLLLQRWAGGDLYTVAGQNVANVLKAIESGDSLLCQLYSMGVLDLRSDMAEKALRPSLFGNGYMLDAQAREDLLLSLSALVTNSLQMLVPSVLVSQSILGGVGCLLLPLRFGYLAEERRAFLSDEAAPAAGVRFPDLGMPPFSTWHLPRGVGWQVGAALAAGYLLRMSASPTAALAGTVLYAGATAVFSIQGAAMVNFLQKSKGTPRVWRVIVPLFLLAISVLVFIGIADQLMNIRGLRKPREPKEDI